MNDCERSDDVAASLPRGLSEIRMVNGGDVTFGLR